MAGTATLNVQVLVDAAKAASDLGGVANKFEDFAKKAGKAFVAAFAFDKIKSFVGDAVNAASDLEQAVGGVDAVFGKSASSIHKWASDTSDNIRLPQADFEKFALQIGAQLKNAGTPMSELGGKTKDLLQLAADLSAQFGGSTSDAVNTLAQSLKGNIATLDNYGVSITAASISSKILSMGLDTSTEAAKAAAKQTAILAIIYEQTADAQGAAGREANSFAAQQEKLNEVWTNFLAKVGAPLLGIFGGLLGAITGLLGPLADMIPVVVQLGEGIANVLLDPVVLVGAAFVAWNAIGGIAGILLNLRVALLLAAGAVRTFFVAIGPVGWALLALTAGWELFKAAMDTGPSDIEAATAAIQDLSDAAKEGGLTMARTKLFEQANAGGFAAALEAAGISLKLYTDASSGVPGAQQELQAAMNKSTDAIFDQGGAFESVGKAAKGAGIGQLEFLSAVASGDVTRLTAEMQAYADQQAAATGNTQTGADIMNAWSEAVNGGVSVAAALMNASTLSVQNQQVLAKALGLTAEEMAGLKDKGEDAVAATLHLAMVSDDLAGAYDRMGKAVQSAADSTQLATTLESARSAADKAGRAMEYVNNQIDTFTGRSASLDDATVDWNSKLRIDPDTTSSVATYVSTVDGAVGTLNDFNTATLGQTKAGEDAYKQLRDLKGSYDDLNQASYEAALKTGGTEAAFAALTKTSQDSRDSFKTWAQPLADAGVDVDALADKVGILDVAKLDPKLLEVLMKDQDAQAALQAFQAAKIDPKTVELTADDLATPAVESAITYIDSITGQPQTIQLGADPADAQSVLTSIIADIASKHPELGIGGNPTAAESELSATLAAINGSTGTATIDANPSKGEGQLSGLTKDVNGTTATMSLAANPSPAAGTVNQTVSNVAGRPDAILSIGANTTPFQGAVSGLIRDASVREATLKITADTGPFYSAWNALPKSGSITVTVNQVQGAVVAPAPAPAMRTTFGSVSAPTLRATTAPGTQGAQGAAVQWNIRVDAGINDPDSVARAIERVVLNRQRRSGTVYAR